MAPTRDSSTALIGDRGGTRFADLDSRLADAVSAGATALATPTCPTAPARAPLNEPDPSTFNGGYTDYRILPTTES